MSAKKKFVVDDSALAAAPAAYPLLPNGVYEMQVVQATITTISAGTYAGRAVINLRLDTPEGRVFWKQVPTWAASAKSTEGEKTWLRMARVAFSMAVGIEFNEYANNLESIIGKQVKVVIGSKDNPGFGLQNFVVTFK